MLDLSTPPHIPLSLYLLKVNSLHTYFLVYVDDINLTGNDNRLLSHFALYVASWFSIKDLGPLSYFVGAKSHYQWASPLSMQVFDKLVDLNNYVDLKPGASSAFFLAPYPTVYSQVVGSLQCLFFTRLYIDFDVNKFSQFMYAPSTMH